MALVIRNTLARMGCAAVVAGLALTTGSATAFAEGNAPLTLTPPSAPVTVRGIACIDQDMNGVCSFGEARVPNVLVRALDGNAVGVTDNSGQYSLQVPARTILEVTVPAGFRSVNGNLHKLHIQMDDSNEIDIALALDTPITASQSTTATTGTTPVNSSVNSAATFSALGMSINSTDALLVTLLTVIALFIALFVYLLNSLRHLYQKLPQQINQNGHTTLHLNPGSSTSAVTSWQMTAEQIVADALGETVSIDETTGILDANAEPNPRFSVVTRDGRTIIFTTDPRLLRRAKIIRHGDRVIDITSRSTQSHAGAGDLWRQVVTIRNMWHYTPPSRAHWYVAVRSRTKKNSKVQGTAISEMPFLCIPRAIREEHA